MKIILTGGGTAGHVMINIMLIPMLCERGHEVIYIGSKHGLEKDMVPAQGMARYYSVTTGKLRRYFSWQNFADFFRLWKGIIEAYRLLRKERPQVIFSAGSFVSVPVMLAGRLCGIPAIIRETDCSMGLANRLCARFARRIYATFPDTLSEYGAQFCGLLIRPALLEPAAGRPPLFDKQNQKPTVLVLGGSLGAERINQVVWQGLGQLTDSFNLIHACGRGKYNHKLSSTGNYRQYEYIDDMAYFYSIADVVITRCGSNAMVEGLALDKRLLCIPLSRNSRGEQVENARFVAEHGCAVLVDEKHLNVALLLEKLNEVLQKPMNHTYALSREQLRRNCSRLVCDIEELGRGRVG